MFTREQYHKAIKSLNAGMTQLKPDGKGCSICGDNGHQAWQCLQNPLFMMQQTWSALTVWRCFHCNAIFTDEEKAAEHFGDSSSELPLCSRSIISLLHSTIRRLCD